MKTVPPGKVITVGQIRDSFAKANHANFIDPITAGISISMAAWVSEQRHYDKTPYRPDGELNPKYPGGVEAQKEKLEAEGHTVVSRGRSNIRYYVKDYRDSFSYRRTFAVAFSVQLC